MPGRRAVGQLEFWRAKTGARVQNTGPGSEIQGPFFPLMLFVQTRVLASPIHGLGLFATEPIAKGTVIWKFDPLLDIKLTPEEVARLPLLGRKFVETYSYVEFDTLAYVLCGDDARFMNHSETPSCSDRYDGPDGDVTSAARDIAAGEELTCDYRSFDHRDREAGRFF